MFEGRRRGMWWCQHCLCLFKEAQVFSEASLVHPQADCWKWTNPVFCHRTDFSSTFLNVLPGFNNYLSQCRTDVRHFGRTRRIDPRRSQNKNEDCIIFKLFVFSTWNNLNTVYEKVGANAATWTDPQCLYQTLGYKSATDWVSVTQGQMSALYLSQHYFEELSGWSAFHKNVRNQPHPSLPSQVYTCAGVCPVSNPSSLSSTSEGKETALAYPSYWLVSKFEKNIKAIGQYYKNVF